MPETATPTLVNENQLPTGMPGRVVVFFQICCAICHGTEVGTSTNLDKFLSDIRDRKKNAWKFSSDRSWTHQKCNRTMPATIKLASLDIPGTIFSGPER